MAEEIVKLFGKEVVSATGEKVSSADSIAGKSVKLIGVYFSAHWCPPCRGFTPILIEYYNKLNAESSRDKGKLEIIFVSSDRDQAAFDEYFGTMPWLGLPFADRKTKDALCAKFEVKGIPMFVLLNRDGSLHSKDGRAMASDIKEGRLEALLQ